MDMRWDFTGRRVIVAGASRGIGRAVAHAFASAGAKVSICSRGAAMLEQTQSDFADEGLALHTAVCDLSAPLAVAQYIDAAVGALGGLDILINNATAGSQGGSDTDWQESVAVDLMGTVRACREAERHLVHSKAGCIVNVASRSALRAAPSTPAYGAIKAAIMHLTQSQAAALARHSIRVNCIAPGSVEFPGSFWDRCRKDNPDLYARTVQSMPFGRLATLNDVVPIVLFLASSSAAWITGQCLVADGGQTLGM